MPPVVKHPRHQKQPATRHSVVQHLVDRALHAHLVKHKYTQHHKSHVTYGRIRDQFFVVRLHHGHQRAVDDSYNGQPDDPRRELVRGVGKQRQAETHQAVGSHLQQHPRQNHRSRRRRLDVRVGQPGVQRE